MLLLGCLTTTVLGQNKIAMTHEGSKTSRFILTGFDVKVLAAADKLDAAAWSKVAAIIVANGTDEDVAKRPPILGEWKVAGKQIIFEPRFPAREGVAYRALFNQSAVFEPNAKGTMSPVAELTIPQKIRVPTAKVVAVYPTRDVLPENLLKFYVHFSAPMLRGEVYQRVQLINDKGKPVEFAFLELDEELWDPSGTRITLLFDPGRVKRGLKPREEAGPILEEGKSYTLVISKDWKDSDGTPMKEEFRKSFKAGPPDNNPLDPKTWKLSIPSPGKTNPLQIRFPKSMEHALLERVVWVEDVKGKRIPGKVSVHEEETLWRFTPEAAWSAGAYKIVAETILEDLAANRIGRPFEVDESSPIAKEKEKKTVEIPFKIAAAP
jgi:hypothetical protein